MVFSLLRIRVSLLIWKVVLVYSYEIKILGLYCLCDYIDELLR